MAYFEIGWEWWQLINFEKYPILKLSQSAENII